jgi:hypothetical protein
MQRAEEPRQVEVHGLAVTPQRDSFGELVIDLDHAVPPLVGEHTDTGGRLHFVFVLAPHTATRSMVYLLRGNMDAHRRARAEAARTETSTRTSFVP